MIPEIKYNFLGLPYHGEIEGSVLTLPNAATKIYPPQSDGAVWIQKHPDAYTPTRTPEQVTSDTANGYTWQEYLTITSSNRVIGGQIMGENSWLYVDDAGRPWLMKTTYTDNGTSLTIKVICKGVFGRFSTGKQYNLINKTIVSETFLKNNLKILGATIDATATNEIGLDASENGKNAYFNIYVDGAFKGSDYQWKYQGVDLVLGCVLDIAISGNGSLDHANLADGISGVISIYADCDAANSSSTYTDENIDPSYYPNLNDPIASLSITPYPTEYGEVLSSCNDCWSFIKTWSGAINYCSTLDFTKNSYSYSVNEYQARMRAVYDGTTSGWLTRTYKYKTGGRQVFNQNGGEQRYWVKDYYTCNAPDCDLTSSEDGWEVDTFGAAIYTGTSGEQIHEYTVTGVSGSVSYNDYSYITSGYTLEPSSIVDPDIDPIRGYYDTQTSLDGTTTGEAPTIELLNARTANIKRASQHIAAITVEGATYQNATTEYISYNPETATWKTSATAQTSFA